jgi:hypothetical protein
LCLVGLFGAGCPLGGNAGLLGLLGASEEDLQALAAAQEEFDAEVEALPSVRVRIINETSVMASVDLQAGVSGPELPATSSVLDELAGGFAGEEFLTSVASASVFIAARGTVEGEIKCGEVIVVSVRAPFDVEGFGFSDNAFGLYAELGNVSLTGLGASGEEDFTGDIVATARFIRPDMDGLDCETGTLVIRIQTPGASAVRDPDTGQLIASQQPGSGTVSVE